MAPRRWWQDNVSESPGCNKAHTSAIHSTCWIRPHLTGLPRAELWVASPGGSPALRDVATLFASLHPSSAAVPLSVRTPEP